MSSDLQKVVQQIKRQIIESREKANKQSKATKASIKEDVKVG